METPRSTSRSRRSYPNLHNLSLAPLSTKYSQPSSPTSDQVPTPRTSYIQSKTAPSTPGILSLSQSRSSSRNGRHSRKPSGYAYDSYFLLNNADIPVKELGDIPKAKSTNALLPGVSFADQQQPQPRERHHKRKTTAPVALHMPSSRHHTHSRNDEWLHRAGLVIAGEMRESKGQSWLVRRDSSTNLVHQTDDYDESDEARRMALLSGGASNLADDELSPVTPRYSRIGSRVGSRAVSAMNSRRGSRAGSHSDMLYSARLAVASGRTSLEIDDGPVEEAMAEPDFVDGDGEGSGDEEEVARLASQRGFGLGGWMDRLIDWTLFSVDEDEEGSDDEAQDEDEDESIKPENMTKEELKLRKEVEAKRKKLEREAIIAASAARSKDQKEAADVNDDTKGPQAQPGPNEGAGGWQDAAWLLSVASKVIL